MNQPKHILLTGATGFLGGYLAATLLTKTDHRLVCLARPKKRKSAEDRVWERISEVIPPGTIGEDRVQVIEGDTALEGLGISSDTQLSIDEVWHCAAVLNFEHHKKKETIKANHGGLVKILNFMSERGIKLINFISTAYVAGKASGIIPESYQEHTAKTNNPYEHSKRLCEAELVNRHISQGINYRILRPSIIIGNSKTFAAESYSGLYGYLSILLRLKDNIELKMPAYFQHNPLHIYTKSGASMNLICVDHVVEIATRICESEDTINDVFHLTNPYPSNIDDSIVLIGEALGMQTQPVHDKELLGPIDFLLDMEEDVFRSYLDAKQHFDCKKAYQLTGYSKEAVRLSREDELVIMKKVKEKFDDDKRVQRNRLKSIIHKFESKTLENGHMEPLPYYTKGEGQPLVILNAYGQSLAFWDRIANDFLKHYKVIIWSMRGTSSQKGGINEVHALNVHGEDIRGILDQEGVDKCHILAWCTGPKIALEFQEQHPERVASMIFLSSCFKGIDRFSHLHTSYENDMQEICSRVDVKPEIMPFVINTIKSVLAGDENEHAYEELTDERKRNLVQEIVGLVTKDIKPMVIEPFLSPQSALNYARQLLVFWEKDVEARIKELKIPVLMVTGSEDKIASCGMSESVAALSQNSKCATIYGGTHYLHYDNAELLAEVVKQFIIEGHDFHFEHGLVTMNKGHKEGTGDQSETFSLQEITN